MNFVIKRVADTIHGTFGVLGEDVNATMIPFAVTLEPIADGLCRHPLAWAAGDGVIARGFFFQALL